MKSESYIQSENGLFKLTVKENGKLEISCKGKKIWSLSTLVAATDFLYFNINGKIIIIGKDNITKWIRPVFTRNTRNGLLLMQNDGNLVVHDHCGRTLWESRSYGKCSTVSGIDLLYILGCSLQTACISKIFSIITEGFSTSV